MAHLGKRLAQQDLVALLDKVSDGVCVFQDVAGRKALVRLYVRLYTSTFAREIGSVVRAAPARARQPTSKCSC
jgi:hypothetical protein